MNNKDLFNAIQNVDENYIANAWDNTEADRPIVIRPEQRSGGRTFRNIMLGIGGTAAAAALGFAVITGANGTLRNPFSGSDDPDESTISYIKDKFNNRKDGADFDPNSPIPVEIVTPDGKLLTYNDLVGGYFGHRYNFWTDYETTAEDIAQMTDLFENFYDRIQPDEHGCNGGFVLKGFTYLPDPETGKINRYNEGDSYYGNTLCGTGVNFDENGNYECGHSFLESPEVTAKITLGEPATMENAHISSSGAYLFTASYPLSDGSNSVEIQGSVGLFTALPQNTPIKAEITLDSVDYRPDEMPSLLFHGSVCSFEPFNEDLKQWLEKDLVIPNASLPDDFNFLSMTNIATKIGDEIRAVDDGEVIYTSNNRILIKHGENLYTSYMIIDVLVNEGDIVKAGDVIGIVNYDHGDPVGPETAYKFTREKPNMEFFNGFGIDENVFPSEVSVSANNN